MQRNASVYILLAFLAFTVAFGCQGPRFSPTHLAVFSGYRGPTLSERNAVTVKVMTQRDWYVKVIDSNPGTLDAVVMTNSYEDKAKGYTGTVEFVFGKVPLDAKIIEVKFQYCSATKCRRETVQVEIQ